MKKYQWQVAGTEARLVLPRGTVIIDAEDLPLIKGSVALAGRDGAFGVLMTSRHERVFVDRLVMGNPVGKVIGHVNHEVVDCRKVNLRVCSRADISHHTKPSNSSRKTSKYKGVCWQTRNQKWRVVKKIGGKQYHVGYFDSETEAARAYDAFVKANCNDFAYVNGV